MEYPILLIRLVPNSGRYLCRFYVPTNENRRLLNMNYEQTAKVESGNPQPLLQLFQKISKDIETLTK